MDLLIDIDTISVGLPIVQVKGSQIEFSKLRCISVLRYSSDKFSGNSAL